MTINKSEGQSLKPVDIYLPQLVFLHGQTVCCNIKSYIGLKVLLIDEGVCIDSTSNILYKEIFRNA